MSNESPSSTASSESLFHYYHYKKNHHQSNNSTSNVIVNSNFKSIEHPSRRYGRSRSLVGDKTASPLSSPCNKRVSDDQDDDVFSIMSKSEYNHKKSNEVNNDKEDERKRQCQAERSATLPRQRRRRAYSGPLIRNPLPPHRVTPDGTAIYYWCDIPQRSGSQGKCLMP